MVKIERNKYCIIVYDEDDGRGITFPKTRKTNMKQYIAEVEKCAEGIKYGTILVPLTFDPKYKENNRPMQKFLEDNNVKSVLNDDSTAEKLYEFYFKHAILQLSPAGVSYIFCL